MINFRMKFEKGGVAMIKIGLSKEIPVDRLFVSPFVIVA